MTRILTATSVALIVLCVFQWRQLRELKAELAAVDARAREAAMIDLSDRRDEVLRVISWTEAARRSPDMPGPLDGVCGNGAPDLDRIGRWLFDTYLLERAKGATEVDARQQLLTVMRANHR
jgi:hypothetical protein